MDPRRTSEQGATDASGPRYPVAVVGCGPVGMSAALELNRQGVRCIVLEAQPALRSGGSRAMRLTGHTLRAWQRVGAVGPILERGLQFGRSRVYHRDKEILCEEHPITPGLPRWLILQQTDTERALLDAINRSSLTDVEFARPVTALAQHDHGVRLDTPTGPVDADYVLACDGAHGAVRDLLGLPFEGRTCADRFIIADLRIDPPWPRERRFWFDPPGNRGRHVIATPLPDEQWRINWQVPSASRAELELESSALRERIRALVGHCDYDPTCVVDYRFQMRVIPRFGVGRVFLAGDAAHLVPPFGGRGFNSGVEDAVNFAWKAALVLSGEAPESLLDSYDRERRAAAATNLALSAARARLMEPASSRARVWRAALLAASRHSDRARRRVKGAEVGPAIYATGRHPLVGHPAPVADLPPRTLTVLTPRSGNSPQKLSNLPLPIEIAHAPAQFDIAEGSSLLLRPDGYVAAVVDSQPDAIRAAVDLILSG